MGRTYKDSKNSSNKPTKKQRRQLEKIKELGITKYVEYKHNEFKSAYKKLKIEEET